MKAAKILDMKGDDLDALMAPAEEAADYGMTLDKSDTEILIESAKAYLHLQEKLAANDLTIKKLRKLLGMEPSSERTRNGDSEQKSKLKRKKKTSSDQPKPGHGKRSAKDFKDVQTEHHKLTDLKKGDPCPESHQGKVYKYEPKCSDPDLDWLNSSGSFGDEYYYDESVDGAEFAEVKVTVSEVSESSLQNLSGMTDFLPTIYLAKSGSDLDSTTPFTEEFDKQLIGMGWAEVPDATASTSDMSHYNIDYWGSTDQVANAEVYVESFDGDTGKVSVMQVTSASVKSQ
jgi:hypothetical protein